MARETYHYDDPEHSPGGLDDVALKMPVMDRDALETIKFPIMAGKPPAYYVEKTEEDIDVGQPVMAFGPPWNQTPVPVERTEAVQKDVIAQYQEDFDVPDVEGLDIGEAHLFGTASLKFKKIDGTWYCCRYALEDDEDEIVEFEDEPSQ